MSADLEQLKNKRMLWSPTDSAEYPFKTKIGGVEYKVRVNDFPEEAMYSVIGNGKVIGDFDDWPSIWER